MSSVIVDTAYLVHSKGSKFYEVISFNNLGNGRRAIMRRWGTATAYAINGGGTTKFELCEGTVGLTKEFGRAVVGKKNRGYSPAHSGHGFHNSREREVNPFTESLLRCHYSNVADVGIIMSGLGLTPERSDLFEQEYDVGLVDDNGEDIIEEGFPVKELERGADWESW
jgi:hypothetical protein